MTYLWERSRIVSGSRGIAVSRAEYGPRLRRWRRSTAFTLIEVMLALAILSVGLCTLLIARNRSIVQLRIADEQVRLRAAASEATVCRRGGDGRPVASSGDGCERAEPELACPAVGSGPPQRP